MAFGQIPGFFWGFLGSLGSKKSPPSLEDLITIPLEFFQLSDQVGIFTVMGRSHGRGGHFLGGLGILMEYYRKNGKLMVPLW